MSDDRESSHVRTDSGELSDTELVRATREGSRRAYAALWKRHSVSALKYARTLAGSDADDVVSEAFLKVYAAIKAGRGPEEDFRYYIRSAVRNTHVSMVRSRRTAPAGDAIEDVVGDRGAEVASLQNFDGSVTARAFLSLPKRWQEVLWYTEVEGLSREHTATLLGMNANAVSALSFRAREALRTAWLQQHISTQSDLDRGCEAVTPLLGAYSRRGLSRRDRLRVEHHVNGCAHCTSVVDELAELLTPGRLALVLLPIALVGGGFAAYATKFGGGSVVAASAIAPTTVAVVAGGASAATGASALSVVGQVAACAIVATMILPPAQMLFEATRAAPTISHSVEAEEAGRGLDDLSLVDLMSTLPTDVPSHTPTAPGGGSTDADPGVADRSDGAPEHAQGEGNPDPNVQTTGPESSGNANAGGSANAGGKQDEKSTSAGVPSANANTNATVKSTVKSTEKSTPGSSANASAKPEEKKPEAKKSGSASNANANPAQKAGPASSGSAASGNAPEKAKANDEATAEPKANRAAENSPAKAAPAAAPSSTTEAPAVADGVEGTPAAG